MGRGDAYIELDLDIRYVKFLQTNRAITFSKLENSTLYHCSTREPLALWSSNISAFYSVVDAEIELHSPRE